MGEEAQKEAGRLEIDVKIAARFYSGSDRFCSYSVDLMKDGKVFAGFEQASISVYELFMNITCIKRQLEAWPNYNVIPYADERRHGFPWFHRQQETYLIKPAKLITDCLSVALNPIP
ncbi:MAG: hypothetical protein V1866_06235 [archaeon]